MLPIQGARERATLNVFTDPCMNPVVLLRKFSSIVSAANGQICGFAFFFPLVHDAWTRQAAHAFERMACDRSAAGGSGGPEHVPLTSSRAQLPFAWNSTRRQICRITWCPMTITCPPMRRPARTHSLSTTNMRASQSPVVSASVELNVPS